MARAARESESAALKRHLIRSQMLMANALCRHLRCDATQSPPLAVRRDADRRRDDDAGAASDSDAASDAGARANARHAVLRWFADARRARVRARRA